MARLESDVAVSPLTPTAAAWRKKRRREALNLRARMTHPLAFFD
jgi:hypothetical protein